MSFLRSRVRIESWMPNKRVQLSIRTLVFLLIPHKLKIWTENINFQPRFLSINSFIKAPH